MIDMLQVLAGIAIVFFVPGYTLVNLLFPRKGELDPEYDIIYRLALGMGLSVVISILVGFGLNALSTEDHGYVTAGPLWTVLISVTAIFVAVGWYRGAYPVLGLLSPRLLRPPPPRRLAGTKADTVKPRRGLDRLVFERELALSELRRFTDLASSTSNPNRQLYYRRRADIARERAAQAAKELKALEGDSD